MAEEGGSPLGETILAPVLMPEKETRLGLCERACLIDLLLTLPSGRGQSGSQASTSKEESGLGGLAQAELETFETSGTALRLIFETMDIVEPSVVVIGSLDPLEIERLGMSSALVATMDVLVVGKDIGVIVVDDGADIVVEHPLDDGGGAWCAAGVEHDWPKGGRSQGGTFHFIELGRKGWLGFGNFGETK